MKIEGIKYFELEEFVPKKVYQDNGELCLYFLDFHLLLLADFIREHFGAPVTVNNWHLKGRLELRGWRPPVTTTGAYYSQHKFGRAMDINVKGMTAQEVYNHILHNERLFLNNGLTTMENVTATPTWTHLDVRHTNSNRLLIINH